MPTYEYMCDSCKEEWECEHSIKQDAIKLCPKCGKETAKILISGGSGKGIVELYGPELLSKLQEDGRKLKEKAKHNEKFLANVIGENKYNDNVKKFGG